MASDPALSTIELAAVDDKVAGRLQKVMEWGIEIDDATETWIREGRPWSPAVARMFAQKGGEAAAESREATKHLSEGAKAKAFLEGKSEAAAKVLVEAMENPDLNIKDRADIAKRILEYGIGRPIALKPEVSDEDEGGDEAEGVSFTKRTADDE